MFRANLQLVNNSVLVISVDKITNFNPDSFCLPLFFLAEIPNIGTVQCRADVVSEDWMKRKFLDDDGTTICSAHGFIVARRFDEQQILEYIGSIFRIGARTPDLLLAHLMQHFVVE
ncbi:hypothetical protein KDL29_05020 [bacterium]|nr:hypothetical protein [bacterium]UNM08405.1 MAG: hypothetical protein H7A35_16385 [Planctomycetales bacterium]